MEKWKKRASGGSEEVFLPNEAKSSGAERGTGNAEWLGGQGLTAPVRRRAAWRGRRLRFQTKPIPRLRPATAGKIADFGLRNCLVRNGLRPGAGREGAKRRPQSKANRPSAADGRGLRTAGFGRR